MSMLLALAAQLSVPVPVNARAPDIRAIFTADDFPDYLIHKGKPIWTVYTRTTVRPDGTVDSCVAETTSGDRQLDAYTCSLIVKRAKLLPARWIDGTAVYGVVRAPVQWSIGDFAPSEEDRLKSTLPDLELSVNHLPKHAHSIVDVDLEVAADERGQVVSCVEWPSLTSSHRRRFPELVPLACKQATDSLVLSPPVNASGKGVRSIQTVSVHFKVDH